MKDVFSVSDGEKDRIRKLHDVASQNKSSVLNEQSVLNDETVTNIISEGPFSGRGVHATLCCSAMMLGYWASTCPLPSVITASNGNRGALYLTIGKMTINGNTPQPGQYFKAIESQGGTPTGNNPNGESSGLIYQVMSTSDWNPFYSTVNFPSAGGCPNCPGVSTWTCNPQYHMSSNYYTGGQGICTELPTNCAIYATEQDCQNSGDPDCAGNDIFVCTQGSCVQNPTGNYPLANQYPSMQQCQQNCQQIKWKCDGSYNCVQDPNGQYTTQQDCQQNCVEPDFTYDCDMTMGQCTQVPGGGGQYPDLATCNQHCEYDGKWTCKEYDTHHTPDLPLTPGKETMKESNHFNPMPSSGWHCVKDPNGPHATQAACQAQCPPDRDEKTYCVNCKAGQMAQVTPPDECPPGYDPVTSLTHGPCTECQNGTQCIAQGWGYGPNYFNSMTLCQQNCSIGGGFECVNNSCQAMPGGQYPTMTICQQNCGQNWECSLNVGCSQDPNGPYLTQVDCETDCCNLTIVNWSWPPYQSGNPTCNEICAKLNTPAMIAAAAGNPINFRHKCRYDWLIAQQASLACPACSASNGCCDNTGYMSETMAAQYQVSSSPYCVNASGSFIGNIEDAMNGINAQNTPFGCGWLNITQGNILSSLPAPNAGTQCNKEGRVAWLDELMTTGTAPGFTANPATMTALYPNGVFVVC